MGIASLPEVERTRRRPLFTAIDLDRFNHQWVTIKVEDSPCVFTKSLVGSILPVVVANGEGKFTASPEIEQRVRDEKLVVFSYVDPNGRRTDKLPHSPSGSSIGAICDPTGRHLASMPHAPDRLFRNSRFPYVNSEMREYEEACRALGLDFDASAYGNIPLDALNWCRDHR
jgi:phosphoribosylformylglycinamidine synthase